MMSIWQSWGAVDIFVRLDTRRVCAKDLKDGKNWQCGDCIYQSRTTGVLYIYSSLWCSRVSLSRYRHHFSILSVYEWIAWVWYNSLSLSLHGWLMPLHCKRRLHWRHVWLSAHKDEVESWSFLMLHIFIRCTNFFLNTIQFSFLLFLFELSVQYWLNHWNITFTQQQRHPNKSTNNDQNTHSSLSLSLSHSTRLTHAAKTPTNNQPAAQSACP